MKPSILLVALAILVLSLQASAQESVRLHIEVYKNGTQVAAPTVSAAEDQRASISLPGVGLVTVSPKRLDGERTAVAIEVVSGEKTMKPGLILVGTEPASVTWQASSDSFEIRIAVVR